VVDLISPFFPPVCMKITGIVDWGLVSLSKVATAVYLSAAPSGVDLNAGHDTI